MEMITTLYTELLALVGKFDGKKQKEGKEQLMCDAAEACLTRKIDIGSFVSSAEKCHIQLTEGGTPILEVIVNGRRISHELTRGAVNTLTKTLGNEELNDEGKQQCISSIVGRIVLTEQILMNYNRKMEQKELRRERCKDKLGHNLFIVTTVSN